MALPLTLYALSLVVAVATSLGIAVIGWHYRDYSGARPLALTMFACAWWSLWNAVALVVTDPALVRLAYRFTYPAIPVVPVAWYLFASQYTGWYRVPSRRALVALFVVPAVTTLLVWTNPSHHLFWTSFQDVTEGSVILEGSKGPAFWVHTAYSYALLTIGSGLLLRMAIFSDGIHRHQAVLSFLAALLPWGANVLYLSGLSDVYDPTVLGLALSGVFLLTAILRRQLLRLVPVAREIAREELLDSMAEGVIVLDARRQVVDVNPAAEGLLEPDDVTVVGRPFAEAFPTLAGAIDLDADGGDRVEISSDASGIERHYEVQFVTLRRGYGATTGYLLTIRDTTDRYEREQQLRRHRQRLEVFNRVLRHDIRNGMNVIGGYAETCEPADDPSERALETIVRKSEEIVTLSRKARQVESVMGGTDVSLEEMDLVAVVDEFVETLAAEFPRATISVDAPDRAVVTTSELVDFALRNVLENALEHNDGPSPTVEVTVESVEEEVVVRVADDGPGIPHQERTVIGEGRETALQHSSGLGLWLVNWILEDARGSFEITENEPRGTVVTVRIPELARASRAARR